MGVRLRLLVLLLDFLCVFILRLLMISGWFDYLKISIYLLLIDYVSYLRRLVYWNLGFKMFGHATEQIINLWIDFIFYGVSSLVCRHFINLRISWGGNRSYGLHGCLCLGFSMGFRLFILLFGSIEGFGLIILEGGWASLPILSQ